MCQLFDQLTVREEEVLALIAGGCSNKEIAASLQISVYTVQNHVQSLLKQLELKNRTEAASVYWQRFFFERSG